MADSIVVRLQADARAFERAVALGQSIAVARRSPCNRERCRVPAWMHVTRRTF